MCMHFVVFSYTHLAPCADIHGLIFRFARLISTLHSILIICLCFLFYSQCVLISRTILPALDSSPSISSSLASEPFNPIGHLVDCKSTAAAILSAGTLLPTAYNEPLAAATGASDGTALAAPTADWAVRFLDACLMSSSRALVSSPAPSSSESASNSNENSLPPLPPPSRRLLTAARVRCVLSQRADLRANDHPALDAARQSGADRLAAALSLNV